MTWNGGYKNYGYDAAGRTTSVQSAAGTTSIAYDYESRITAINGPGISTSYTYNGLNTRVGRTSNVQGSFTYRRDGVGVTAPVLGDGTAKFTPGGTERRGSTSAFRLGDYLGSTTRITSSSQTVTDTRQYDAFGQLVSSTGTTPTPFGFVGDEGYQSDADTGLQLLGHRYYDPSTGRFLTRDPAKDGRNWYGYVENNPNSYVDPNGKWVFIPWLIAAGGAALGLWGVYQLWKDPSLENLIGVLPWGKLYKTLKAAAKYVKWVIGAKKLPKPYVDILRKAIGGRGNYGLGSATAGEADEMGKLFVGPGYRTSKDGTALVSADGKRIYRRKIKSKGNHEANFENWEQNADGSLSKTGNGHMSIN